MKALLDRRKFLESALKLPFICSASYAGLGFRLTHAIDVDNSILNEHQSTSLQQICYRLFPYPEVGDEPYRLAVSAMSVMAKDDQGVRSLIKQGIDSMDSKQDKAWIELGEAQQIAILEQVEQGDFFQWLYGVALNQIYTNKEIWDHIGYEGSSMEFGGYLNRGFDDIDWL